jgi:hypothetical protein
MLLEMVSSLHSLVWVTLQELGGIRTESPRKTTVNCVQHACYQEAIALGGITLLTGVPRPGLKIHVRSLWLHAVL